MYPQLTKSLIWSGRSFDAIDLIWLSLKRSIDFKIWMLDKVKTLINKGTVSLHPENQVEKIEIEKLKLEIERLKIEKELNITNIALTKTENLVIQNQKNQRLLEILIGEELELGQIVYLSNKEDIEELEKAKNRVDSGESDPIAMVDRIISKNEGYKDENEVMDMQYYAHQLNVKEEQLSREISDAENIIDKSRLIGERQQLSDEMDRQTKAARIAGNKWGKIGEKMQPIIDTSFNIHREKNLIEEAYENEVPKEVKEKIESLTKERDSAIEERNKIEKKLIDALSKKAESKIKSEAKKSKLAETKEQLIKEENVS